MNRTPPAPAPTQDELERDYADELAALRREGYLARITVLDDVVSIHAHIREGNVRILHWLEETSSGWTCESTARVIATRGYTETRTAEAHPTPLTAIGFSS